MRETTEDDNYYVVITEQKSLLQTEPVFKFVQGVHYKFPDFFRRGALLLIVHT